MNKTFSEMWKSQCSSFNINIQPSILPPVKRIIVMGDIHGDWSIMIKMLKLANVIDDKLQWIGGDTVVVQVGDQIDRCRNLPCNNQNATQDDEGNDWKILQFFTDLHKLAELMGGAVYSLMGNHELMNTQGDMRYVSYKGMQELNKYQTEYKIDGKYSSGKELREYLFKPGNKISNFLGCTRQFVLIIGSNLFVHAGILPEIANKYKISDMNEIMSKYLWNQLENVKNYDDLLNSSSQSPLWNRTFGNIGLNTTDVKQECPELLNPLKQIYKVDRIYVGHTPIIKEGIKSVCNGKVWLTDYGASKAFSNFKSNPIQNAFVLEILNDTDINILH